MNGYSRVAGRVAAACWIAGALLGAQVAWAQEKEGGVANADAVEAIKDKARRLWHEGLAAADADNSELALARFRESQALYPHVGTLRNLGVVEVSMDGYAADGANHLAYFLAHAEELPPNERRKVDALLAKTEERVGRLELDIEPPDASLELDGKRVEPPLTQRVLYVLPGKHDVVVRLANAKPIEREVDLGAGQRQILTIALGDRSNSAPVAAEPSPAAVPVPKAPAAPPKEEGWPDAKLWAVLGGSALTAAALGVGIYGEVWRRGAKDDAEGARSKAKSAFSGVSPCAEPAHAASALCQDLEDAVADQESAATIANVGWLASGVFAAATVGVWLLWPGEPQEQGVLPGAPWVSSQGAGWTVAGRF